MTNTYAGEDALSYFPSSIQFDKTAEIITDGRHDIMLYVQSIQRQRYQTDRARIAQTNLYLSCLTLPIVSYIMHAIAVSLDQRSLRVIKANTHKTYVSPYSYINGVSVFWKVQLAGIGS